MEYGHKGVRVNSVHPGGIDTAMGNPFSEARAEANKRYTMVPLQRIGEPSEVAYTSLFLASDEASYLCGAEIAVDGGMLHGQYYIGFPGAPAARCHPRSTHAPPPPPTRTLLSGFFRARPIRRPTRPTRRKNPT